MKKSMIIVFCLILILSVSACVPIQKNDSSEETNSSVGDPFAVVTEASVSDETEITPVASDSTAPTVEDTTATTKAVPVNTAKMYTSYAFMVTYDPTTGWAEFDYFDALKGDAAVEWLIDEEGYSSSEAQECVDELADAEFITKNVNPQLRTVDLSVTPFKLMYGTDGKLVGTIPVSASFADLNTIYAMEPTLIMNSCWYSVTVTDGIVSSVEQLYYP
jgi:hypothetical protein